MIRNEPSYMGSMSRGKVHFDKGFNPYLAQWVPLALDVT